MIRNPLRLLLSLSLLSSATLAHAHPGHPGHDLIWEATGSSAHMASTTVLYVALVAAVVWAARWISFRRASNRRDRPSAKN